MSAGEGCEAGRDVVGRVRSVSRERRLVRVVSLRVWRMLAW